MSRKVVYVTSRQVMDPARIAADFLNSSMQDLLAITPLPEVPYTKKDIDLLWDDVKESICWTERKERIRLVTRTEGVSDGYYTKHWENPERHESTLRILKKCRHELDELYSLSLTSHLIKWYSIFKPPYIEMGRKDSLLPIDYKHFFMLRGKDRWDSLQELGDVQFYTLVHRLATKQLSDYRAEVLRGMMKDEAVVDALSRNAYVVPINLQFVLTTPQVYNYYFNHLDEDNGDKPKRERGLTKDTKDKFKEVERLIRYEGLSIEEAMRTVLSDENVREVT